MGLDLSIQKDLMVDPEGQKEVYELIDPRTKEPLSDEDGIVTLTVWGPDSTVYKAFDRKNLTKNLKKRRKKGAEDITEADVEEGEKIMIERCIAIVEDWENIGYDGDSECTPENKRKVFEAAPWIVEQVNAFASERANFMKG